MGLSQIASYGHLPHASKLVSACTGVADLCSFTQAGLWPAGQEYKAVCIQNPDRGRNTGDVNSRNSVRSALDMVGRFGI